MDALPSRVYWPRALVLLAGNFDDASSTPFASVKLIPRTVSISRNSARKCDTASIEFDFRDFPFDPRTLTSCHVAVHLEALKKASAPMIPSRLNLRFVGTVDEIEVTWSNDGERIKVECRDYTARFFDAPWTACCPPSPPAPSLQIATPIGVTLLTIVDGIRALVAPDTLPLDPATSRAAATAMPNLVTGRLVYTPRDKKESAWEAVCGLCDLHGLVPVWDLDVLHIRTAAETTLSKPAIMVYGQNVESLRFKRNLLRPEKKGVRVTSWNPQLGQSLSASWADGRPGVPTPDLATKSAKGSAPSTPPVVEYHIEGPATVGDLLKIAERLYDERRRSKIDGELETRDLTDLVLGPLLGLANGDRVQIHLDPGLQSSVAGMSQAEAVAFLSNPLKTNALDPAVATALMAAWTQAQTLACTFYVLEAHHRWDRDDGYTLRIRFGEFVLGV